MPMNTVELTIDVSAPEHAVWRVIRDPACQPAWLGGFRIESRWEVGAPFALVGTLQGRAYRESGTILAYEPGRRLSYDHWSRLWRVPDAPDNRAVWTLTTAPTATGCRVDLRHELPDVEAIAPHARFFWRGALHQLKRLAEGDPGAGERPEPAPGDRPS